MVRNEILAEIFKLDVVDRQYIVDTVRATLPDETSSELSPEEQEVLQQRLEASRRDPGKLLSWEQVKALLQEDRKKVRA